MKIIHNYSRITIALVLVLTAPVANAAGLLEQILGNPRVQALLGRPTDVVNSLNLCKNDAYRTTNSQTCADASNTDSILKLPIEMRTVMSNPQSAQSLRDLCLAAQTTPQRATYLCAELLKADTKFANAVSNDQSDRFMKSIQQPNSDKF